MDLNASASGYFGAKLVHISIKMVLSFTHFTIELPYLWTDATTISPRPIWQHIRKPLSVADEADSAPAKRERESSKLT